MRQPWSLSILAFVVLPSVLWASGCPIKIPDVEICADKGKLGAVCASLHSKGKVTRRVRPAEWQSARIGMFCLSPKGLGEMNAVIEKACQNRQCVEDTKNFIKALQQESKDAEVQRTEP